MSILSLSSSLSHLHIYTNTKNSVSYRLREMEVSEEILTKLQTGKAAIRSILHNSFSTLFEDYLKRLDNETTLNPNDEVLIDRNSRLACDLHAHKLLIYRNYQVRQGTTLYPYSHPYP